MPIPSNSSSASSIDSIVSRRRASVSAKQQPMRSSAGFSSIPTSSRRSDDPFEKPDRHSRHSSTNGPALMGEVRSRMAGGSRGRLLKAVALIGVVTLLFFMLAPGDQTTSMRTYLPKVGNTGTTSSSSSHLDTSHIDHPGVEDTLKDDSSSSVSSDKETTKVSTGGSKHDGSSHSSSHTGSSKGDDDGDVASDPSVATDKCTKSYSKDKPLIQYVLMIDAGSTGSRIHVYRFNNCGPTPELEDEVFEKTEPKAGAKGSGLSEYADDPKGAAKSLDVLMDVALEKVPKKLQGCTPVAVKATAGLRKVGEKGSQAILKAVRERLENEYPFPVVGEDDGGVEVMEGEDEAVYAWITVNYLKERIGTADDVPTAAVFDLGGGSTQIVFEPTFADAEKAGKTPELAKGDHRHELSFGGRDFILYQHSYLGYGLMEARNNMYKVVYESAMGKKKNKSSSSEPIPNPCLLPGTFMEAKIELDDDEVVKVNMTGPSVKSADDGALNAAQCRAYIEKTIDKEASCKIKPCSFNGVHQPSFSQTFAANDVFLLSYFFDRVDALGMPESFSIAELKALSHRVCAGSKQGSWADFEEIEGAIDELEGRPESCHDLSYMVSLLLTGYGMPIDREVKIAKKIGDNELGWCLGASLPLLSNKGWQCKLTKDV